MLFRLGQPSGWLPGHEAKARESGTLAFSFADRCLRLRQNIIQVFQCRATCRVILWPQQVDGFRHTSVSTAAVTNSPDVGHTRTSPKRLVAGPSCYLFNAKDRLPLTRQVFSKGSSTQRTSSNVPCRSQGQTLCHVCRYISQVRRPTGHGSRAKRYRLSWYQIRSTALHVPRFCMAITHLHQTPTDPVHPHYA
ncbi:hypothetical protein HDV57DRAFT_90268 [Trichoderma longibrachiatum]